VENFQVSEFWADDAPLGNNSPVVHGYVALHPTEKWRRSTFATVSQADRQEMYRYPSEGERFGARLGEEALSRITGQPASGRH
jgi:hypothetical protein